MLLKSIYGDYILHLKRGELTSIVYTGMCRQKESGFQSPNSETGYPLTFLRSKFVISIIILGKSVFYM